MGHLSTLKSNTYQALVKALLVLYFSGCRFRLGELTLTVDGKSQKESVTFQQRFTKALPKQMNLPEERLALLFSDDEEESQALLTCLMNLVMSLSSKHAFDHAWRAFNALYAYLYQDKKQEREQLKAVGDALGFSKQLGQHMSKSFKSLVEAWFENNRLYSCLLENTGYELDIKTAEKRYHDFYGTKAFSDKAILKRLLDYYDARFVAELPDETLDKQARSQRKSYRNKVQKQIAEGKFVNADYIYLAISYIYHYRNAQFHGRAMVNDFLMDNANSQELASLALILQELCIAMIMELFEEEK
ncbi:MAG: hypothetical protein SPD91_01120 [Streptococcus hyointestinalis]|uniref:hypothetical protein n=1 Tax=Streptococcus hyointestinalis TaxID=1337 RepID=UPI0023EFD1F7|nr:hypothetical protein [Streptococcus hyointestinalis]MCI6871044.1 hypothetical protein [Streptococcus hyointestinalis]MDD7356019.1 hypothetical protein [Streptococcus hyointestinalis]MDY4553059.1 hypothetical protein [Streptococcus hyointestinalis]